MTQPSGAQINRKTFTQSIVILLVFMLLAGVLTRLIPAGKYDRLEQDGVEMVIPGSFQYTESPDYPVWRWFFAPIEALFGPNGLTILVIILFLLMVGVAFAVLDRSGILQELLARIVRVFKHRKYILLLVISFFFMLIGAFFGIFEEVIPLVPLIVGLSYFLGWDVLVGLGMSILATNMGFSAAVTNPFTIGIAQEIAGLPLFSGFFFRILIFLTIYIIFAAFLTLYARRVERNPQAVPVEEVRQAVGAASVPDHFSGDFTLENARFRKAAIWLGLCLSLVLLVLVSGPLLPALSDFALPLVGLLFLAAGLGAGFIVMRDGKKVGRAAVQGLVGISPAIPLILMAAGVQYIVYKGGILDTLLYQAANTISQANPYVAILLIYLLALLIEFFIPSGSAKAFLLMPILVPLADLVGLTRQVTVTAFCFGDGFSNLAYPVNPVLLICLGLAAVGYSKWLKWTLKLWFWVILATIIFLWIGVAIEFGPF